MSSVRKSNRIEMMMSDDSVLVWTDISNIRAQKKSVIPREDQQTTHVYAHTQTLTDASAS